MSTFALGTRSSQLARIQTDRVLDRLEDVAPDLDVRVVTRETSGDRFAEQSIHTLSGKGFFTKDLDDAVVSGEVDAAVHSAKDVPTDSVPGLVTGAYLDRTAPGDVLVARSGVDSLSAFDEGARIGTSSLRRKALLLNRRPDLNVQPIRGNVDTRLEKLFDREEFDGLVLAEAGLRRLERTEVITERLDPVSFYPAPGQGAILVQCRDETSKLTDALEEMNDETTRLQVRTERIIIEQLEGGCRIPLGAFCDGDQEGGFTIHGMVASIDGERVLTASASFADAEDQMEAARTVVEQLKDDGAEALIERARTFLKNQESQG